MWLAGFGRTGAGNQAVEDDELELAGVGPAGAEDHDEEVAGAAEPEGPEGLKRASRRTADELALAGLPLPLPVPFNYAINLADPRFAHDAAPPPGVSRPAQFPPVGLQLVLSCLRFGARPRKMTAAAAWARRAATAKVCC